MADDVRTAVARRDAAIARTRRVTGLGVLLGLGATFVVSAVAAGSTHARKVVVHVTRTRRPAAAPVAPAPPLVSAGSEESPAAPSAPSTATQAPAPAATAAPPVVVSGGS